MIDESFTSCTDGIVVFKGYNDSPFDKAIYSANHLLCAPGGCKASSLFGGMMPVSDNGNSPVMSSARKFCNMFSPDDAGYEAWKNGLVTRAMSDDLVTYVLIEGMKPSIAFPCKMRFYKARNEFKENTIDHTLFAVRVTNPNFVNAYKEKRVTRHARRMLTRTNEDLTSSRPNLRGEKGVVMPDNLFCGEDGVVKAFRLFNTGDYIHHRHNGGIVEENTPSAVCYSGGFYCFGCAPPTAFAIPCEYESEEKYPFVESETISSDVHDDRSPDVCWKTRMEKKFFVLSAPKGSGKTHQLGELMNEAFTSHMSVCVVSFRQYLAQQQAIRLKLLCYLELTDDELLNDVFTGLVIVVNSLHKIRKQTFDIVIFDECGLIRRHLLNKTCTNVLSKVFKILITLVNNA